MRIKIFVLLCMIFMHIIADYNLQGWLASAKQKEWWKKNAPDELYKNDWIVALVCHSFMWAFMVLLPTLYYGIDVNWFAFFVCLLCTHVEVDDFKANKKRINLVQDQLLHFMTIFICWMGLVLAR